MAPLPMFYGNVSPVSSEQHRNFRIRPATRPVAFAAGAHLVPAVIEEFAVAAHHFPVVFAPTDAGFASVFLCGLRPGENSFVDVDGRWSGPYLPAYLRRYPFILGERGDADPILCIDDHYSGFGEGEEGQRLFEDDGKPTPYLDTVMRLVADYAKSARRTEEACALLAEMKLMRAVTFDVTHRDGGSSASIHGLSVLDEDKLNALDAEAFERLREKGILGALYAHLFSIGSTSLLAERLEQANASKVA